MQKGEGCNPFPDCPDAPTVPGFFYSAKSKTMIKYKAIIYGPQIDVWEIISESENFVTFRDEGRRQKQTRESKVGTSAAWFDTWEEARDWLKGIAERSLESAKQRRIAAEKQMDAIRDLVPPM